MISDGLIYRNIKTFLDKAALTTKAEPGAIYRAFSFGLPNSIA